ncbi:MAG: polysaccharide export protein [Devosia sp.]|nr:polysaccharide export protein [Devosia sp.]
MAALVLSLAGCAPGAFLSESGPTREAVLSGAQATAPTDPAVRANYVQVNIDESAIARLAQADHPSMAVFGSEDRGGARGLIGVGDDVGVTVFESDSGGLFLPREPGTRAGNFVTMPAQQVDAAGDIRIPYIGALRAAGRTANSLGATIEARLADRALEPQAIVSVIDRRAAPVSVLGEINGASTFSLDPGGLRILGAIAKAGGPKYPGYESMVTLQRNGEKQSALLSDIAMDPRQNIQLRPNDTIYVSHAPQYFIALGATGSAQSLGPVDRRLPFQDSRITLADALGRAGGMIDQQANARGVFVFRYEPRATVAALGVADAASLPPMVPTVYTLDLTEPASFFHASRFWIHNEDVLYVANAPATDLSKFLAVVLQAGASGAAWNAATH